jgi:hypothetical protein
MADVAQQHHSKHGKIILENLMGNMKKIDKAVTVIFIIGGVIAGILGCTGLEGLVMIISVSILCSLALSIKMKFQLKTFTDLSVFGIISMGITNHAMSFVLFWTLAYALVHIY